MINALCDQANAFRGEAPQECATAFIDSRHIEHEIYGFAAPDRLLAAGLNRFGARRGNLAILCPVESLGFRCTSAETIGI